MKDAICPLCGSYENEKSFSEKNYDVLACKSCELFFIYPYENDIHEKVSTNKYDNLEIIAPYNHYAASKRYYKKYFPSIENECKNAISLLDVGCGTGYRLYAR